MAFHTMFLSVHLCLGFDLMAFVGGGGAWAACPKATCSPRRGAGLTLQCRCDVRLTHSFLGPLGEPLVTRLFSELALQGPGDLQGPHASLPTGCGVLCWGRAVRGRQEGARDPKVWLRRGHLH